MNNHSKTFFSLFFIAALIMVFIGLQTTPIVHAQGNGKSKPYKAICGTVNDGKVRCHSHVIMNTNGNPEISKNAITSATGPYGPVQLQTAYKLTGSASGRILAIVDAYDDPTITADLATYNNGVGLPSFPTCTGSISTLQAPCFQKVDQNGGNNYPTVDSGWALEESLDVEVAHASCPDCKLLLVEANSSSYTDLLAAVDRAVAMGATVVSNSYGSNEFSGETSLDYHFQKTGVAFTFSAGDNGYGTSYPAASRYVTSVGGTSLYLNSDNTYNSERVWAGTGSGCSSYESQLSFQPYIGCARRVMNDVAADADPNTGAAVFDSTPYSGYTGWFQVGGTSLSSPIIAASYALKGIPSTAQANALPYINNPSINLHDITVGTNSRRCRNNLCRATVGFDGPTGLGTPNGINDF